MKKYTAQINNKQLVLVSEDQKEIGRIVELNKFFSSRHYIIFNSRSYDIKNVGFLKNDAELFNSKGVIYFTDLGKERIIKSGADVRIYNFKLSKTNQLFEKGKLLIEVITEEKKKLKYLIYHVEVDESVDDLLTLFFLHYSTQEFSSIGGDGD